MQQMELYEEYPEQLSDLVEVEGMDLHLDKAKALEALKVIEEKINDAKQAAEAYQAKLEISSQVCTRTNVPSTWQHIHARVRKHTGARKRCFVAQNRSVGRRSCPRVWASCKLRGR